jgi:Fe-S cluster biogenesis protein NfuA
MFIQTEDTPNPATMKFIPGREVMAKGTLDIVAEKDALQSPLAERLFAVDGVRGVFLAGDFISVTKAPEAEWTALKPAVLTAVMEHFSSGLPVVREDGASEEAMEDEDPVVTQIRDLIDHKVRPAVAQDGGDIVFRKFEDGVVYLTLKGACAGCPNATVTLKAGVESLLRRYVPEVREVRKVD